MKKILVPTDFSEVSEWAVEVATGIAQKSNAEIVLLHVVDQLAKQSFNVGGEWELSQDLDERVFTLELIKNSKKELNDLGLAIQDKGINVSVQLKFGSAHQGIAKALEEHDVDLIVMGTLCHTRLERIFVGSTSEKVIKSSRCPVLTVHEHPGSQNFKNIVYATSITDEETAFSKVLTMAQQLYDSTIHLVRINTPSNFLPDQHIKKSMEEFAERLHLENYTLNIFNDTSEEAGILHFAESIHADLIGTATQSRSGFIHLLTGSISKGILSCSKRPVLTFLNNGPQ